MKIQLWHGTNQSFDHFDADMLGLNTANDASRSAFFFAVMPATAEEYARQAARNLVPGQIDHEATIMKLMIEANRAMKAGKHDIYEARILEAEDLESKVMQAGPQGAKILRCEVTFSKPFEIDGCDHEVIRDLGGVIEKARAAGFDAVILRGINDTPLGLTGPDDHVAVFDVSQISIIETLELDDLPEPESESDRPDFD